MSKLLDVPAVISYYHSFSQELLRVSSIASRFTIRNLQNSLFRLGITILLTFSFSNTYSQIQPAACSNTVIPVTAAIQNFYDPGGIGGNPCVPDVANNYPNSGCITSYQFASPIGTTILLDFSVLSLYNTVNGWDWMVIYDGGNNVSPIIYDNRAGAPDNDGLPVNPSAGCFEQNNFSFCSSGNQLFMEFYASGVISREGWEATVTLCTAPCTITNITTNITTCNPGPNNYDLAGSIDFVTPPVAGTLTITDCHGNNQSFNAPFVSPINYNLTGITADGIPCDVTAVFSADPLCTFTANYAAPPPDAPPTASNPLPINVQCIGQVPLPDVLVVTDEADNSGTPVVTYVGDVSDNGSCPETITRTYRITDACGNFIDVIQLIIINDTQIPVMAAPLADIAYQCSGDVPAMADLGWTDNCDGAGTVAGNEVSDGLSCPETITRTWTYTDVCGNVSATVTQIITVDDTQLPVFTTPPADIAVQCVGDVPAMTDLGWTDNCDGAANATGTDGALTDPCGGTITRTWTYTDACGNNATVTQTITVDDTTLPTATNPAPQAGTPPAFDPTQVTDEADNCGVPTVTDGGDISNGGNCPEIITRTYIITDECGNTTTVEQTFTIGDAVLPTASNPTAINVECQVNVPATDPTVVTDEADNGATPIVTWEDDTSDGLSCPETILRRYRVTDDCGNFIFVTQTITVWDVTAPVMAAPPAAVAVQCIGDVPAMTNLGYTDNCDPAGTVAGSDVSDGLSCPETITRSWTWTDVCGNNATVTQTITVDDTTLPTASNLAPISVAGIGAVPPVNILDVFDEADNCTVNPVVVWVSDVSDNGNCPEIITRTYSVTDDCGNSITVTQIISVGDPVMPTGTAPADVTVECIVDVPAADPLLITDEADNQGAPVVAWVGDVSDNGSCPETITRTYSITDACGNQITVDQIITVNDVTNPTATAPATVNVECIGDVPVANILDITNEADNCTLNPVVAHAGDVSDNGSCPETITRTYSITDDCGNSITVDQLIIVNDVTNPTGTASANVNVECIGDVPVADVMHVLNVADNCTVNPVVVHVGDQSDGLSCPETITRTYSITDDCGNSITVDQLIIVNDVTNPTATNPVAISVPGSMDVPAPDPTVVTTEADNCTLNPVVAWVSDVSDGNACNLEKITRTYSVTDDCGNQILVTQIITILAVPAPIDAGPDQTLCGGELVTIVADNPWNVQIVWNPNVPNGPFDPIQTTTYTVTADNLGCISTDDITITVELLPTINFSGDSLSGCEPLTVNFTNNSSAPSGLANCEWLINGQTISNCGNISYTFQNSGTYDVTLTTTSMTGCTNSETYQDYIYVEEIPLASFTPSTNEVSNMSTEVSFTNNSVGATNYAWDFGDGSTSTQENPTNEFPYDEAGVYIVELIATSPLGCTDVAYATISAVEELIYWIPNSFTPDGDNYNEYFKPQFTSGHDPYDFNMFIYNRWGELIWESHDATIGWDGTFGAGQKIVQDGTYNWKIDFKTTANDERIMLTGSVTLIK